MTLAFVGVVPSTVSCPPSGRRKPSSKCSNVDLPAPLGPSNPNTSPCSTRRSSPLSTSSAP